MSFSKNKRRTLQDLLDSNDDDARCAAELLKKTSPSPEAAEESWRSFVLTALKTNFINGNVRKAEGHVIDHILTHRPERTSGCGRIQDLLRRGLPGDAAGIGAAPGIDLFVPRAEMGRLLKHMNDDASLPGLALLGDLGAGKSALLWRLVARINESHADGARSQVATVDAVRLTLEKVSALMAAQLCTEDGTDPVTLLLAIAGRPTTSGPVLIVVDSLDEAQAEEDPEARGAAYGVVRAPGEVIARWLCRLVRNSSTTQLRLLVAARKGSQVARILANSENGSGWAEPVDLSNDPIRLQDVEVYVKKLLLLTESGTPFAPDADVERLLDKAKTEIARKAEGNFLVAQRVTMAIRAALQRGNCEDLGALPGSLKEAFTLDLERRIPKTFRHRVDCLLWVVALTGTVPRSQYWSQLAKALDLYNLTWDDGTVSDLLTSPETSAVWDYLRIEVVYNVTQTSPSEHVTLFHAAFSDWLLATLPEPLRNGHARELIVTALDGKPNTEGCRWDSVAQWHCETAVRQAALACACGKNKVALQLIRDWDVFVHTSGPEGLRLMNMLEETNNLSNSQKEFLRCYRLAYNTGWRVQSPAQRAYQLHHIASRYLDFRNVREALEQLCVLHGSSPHLGTKWTDESLVPMPLLRIPVGQPTWAIATGSDRPDSPDSEALIITGSDDRTVRAWTADGVPSPKSVYDGCPGVVGVHPTKGGHDWRVTSVAFANDPDSNKRLVVSAGVGEVRVWRLSGGPWKGVCYEGQAGLLARMDEPFALTVINESGRQRVIACGRGATVKSWEIGYSQVRPGEIPATEWKIPSYSTYSLNTEAAGEEQPVLVGATFGVFRILTSAGEGSGDCAARQELVGLCRKDQRPCWTVVVVQAYGCEPAVVGGTNKGLAIWPLRRKGDFANEGDPRKDFYPRDVFLEGRRVRALAVTPGANGESLLVVGTSRGEILYTSVSRLLSPDADDAMFFYAGQVPGEVCTLGVLSARNVPCVAAAGEFAEVSVWTLGGEQPYSPELEIGVDRPLLADIQRGRDRLGTSTIPILSAGGEVLLRRTEDGIPTGPARCYPPVDITDRFGRAFMFFTRDGELASAYTDGGRVKVYSYTAAGVLNSCTVDPALEIMSEEEADHLTRKYTLDSWHRRNGDEYDNADYSDEAFEVALMDGAELKNPYTIEAMEWVLPVSSSDGTLLLLSQYRSKVAEWGGGYGLRVFLSDLDGAAWYRVEVERHRGHFPQPIRKGVFFTATAAALFDDPVPTLIFGTPAGHLYGYRSDSRPVCGEMGEDGYLGTVDSSVTALLPVRCGDKNILLVGNDAGYVHVVDIDRGELVTQLWLGHAAVWYLSRIEMTSLDVVAGSADGLLARICLHLPD